MLSSVVLILVSLIYVTPKTIFVSIDPNQLPDLFNKFMICIDKTGVDSNTMEKIKDWKFEDKDSVKKYMYCFAKDSGFGDNDGHLVKENIVQLIGNHQLRSQFLNAIDECNKLKGNNKYDTIYKTTVCFRNTSPVLFKL